VTAFRTARRVVFYLIYAMLYSYWIYTLETKHRLSDWLSNVEWKLHTHTHTNAYAHATTQTNTSMLTSLGIDIDVSLQSKEIKAVTALLRI
jgi:hypothetical protein